MSYTVLACTKSVYMNAAYLSTVFTDKIVVERNRLYAPKAFAFTAKK